MVNIVSTLHPHRARNKALLRQYEIDHARTNVEDDSDDDVRKIATAKRNDLNMTLEDVLSRKIRHATHLEGQLLEARETVDNWSQADNFFHVLNKDYFTKQYGASLGFRQSMPSPDKLARLTGHTPKKR
jgi:vacuolar-type H+-ATPase subunit I/STV1